MFKTIIVCILPLTSASSSSEYAASADSIDAFDRNVHGSDHYKRRLRAQVSADPLDGIGKGLSMKRKYLRTQASADSIDVYERNEHGSDEKQN